MDDAEPTTEDAVAWMFNAILNGRRAPLQGSYRDGWRDYRAGVKFHDGPRPLHSCTALSWRMGWNAASMSRKPEPDNTEGAKDAADDEGRGEPPRRAGAA